MNRFAANKASSKSHCAEDHPEFPHGQPPEALGNPEKRRRTAVRYVRDDISALIQVPGVFGMGIKILPVRLADISAKGAGIIGPKKLKVGRKIVLFLTFKDGTSFDVASRIVRKCDKKRDFYGLQFIERNDLLADHVLRTQSKLVVK